jgi:CYTH domain-containing protein
MSAYENEREITEAEFESLSERRDENTRAIKKHRHTFVFSGQLFEIDVYPEWKNTAILETELADRNTTVEFPSFLKIVSDVTGDKRYSNASMSRKFPDESEV